MPDPIEELSNFEPGVPVNPMPAAEVRRRGERRRRRNAALVVGGAVAAVVLVAVPIAVVAGDDGGGKPQPAPPAGLTADVLLTADEVPARERLTAWTEVGDQGPVLACAPADAGLDPESSVRRDFTAGIADATPEDLPASVVRTEVLEFGSAAAATAAYDTALGWVLDCPGLDNVNRDAAEWAVVIEGGGQGEWRMHTRSAPEYCGGGDCDAAVFDRMGVARFGDRLVAVSLAEVGGPLEPEGLDATMEDLFNAAISKAGGVITGGSSSGEATGGPEPGALDFPIDTGLRVDGDSAIDGPGANTEGIILPEGFCGSAAWPAANTVGRLAVQVTGPEYGLWRELVTFGSAEEAAALVAELRDAVGRCAEVAGDQPANDLAFESHPVESGYDDATFSYTYREGLGGVVYQFVRVGHAVLATAQSGEWAPETTPQGARALNGENEQLTALMCEFTEAGC